MTKAGFVKRHLAAIDKDIDEQIAKAKKMEASALEQAMLDKVMRPYAKLLEMNRMANSDPGEFVDSTFWLLAVLSVECILNTHDKGNPQEVYESMQGKVVDYANQISAMLKLSLSPTDTTKMN